MAQPLNFGSNWTVQSIPQVRTVEEISPAEPLNPDMNARRSSQWDRYSLESDDPARVRIPGRWLLDEALALVFAGYDERLDRVLFLVH